MASRSLYPIELSDEQRATLEKRARAYSAEHREVVRAKIVLLAADGVGNAEIARRLDTSPQLVRNWRKRFAEEGLPGLEDRPRSGRRPSFPPSGGGRSQGDGL